MNAPTSTATPERILQRLEWQVIRRLDGLLQGDYRSLFYGYGVDFADLREYQPEDDVRYIDWNVTARMDTPYVRQYIEDREITAWFLLDFTPSMDFGSGEIQKKKVLLDLVTTLARLLTLHGNRIGVMLYTNHVERIIPARGGRNQVLVMIDSLLRTPSTPPGAFTNLTPMLSSALQMLKKRSVVLVVSDFISAPGWQKPLSLLSQRHEVIPVRVWDPGEMEIPDVGVMVLEDMETGEQLYVDSHDPQFRMKFAELSQQRETALRESFSHAGVDALTVSTGEDLVRSIMRFAALRKQRRK